jgi:large subunit ribosomal protein L24
LNDSGEAMNKIRKGDDVMIVAGRDKGKRGTVLRIVDAEHVLVEGANRVKKHQRPNPMKGITGGIIDKEMPLHISNVALYNPGTKKADRVGIRVMQDGRRARYFKSNGEVVDV